ncbi:carboxypeptidase regulatory-like domain-containing protein [Candidatus Woesearchaeota archaeon]|nr:carboxypeptidase regulatory-like domain-containing protein [Candidatus Woesearchaeota archaeon]
MVNIKKSIIIFCIFFLLNIALVSAFDIKPVFTRFMVVTNPVIDTAGIAIQAHDPGSNAGLLWVSLYEDNVLIDTENCGSLATCSWMPIVSRSGGTYSYYAVARDKGGNEEKSDTIQITFSVNLAPEYSNLAAIPASPVTYDALQNYQFNATWIDDNSQLSAVVIEHDFSGTLTNYTVTTNNGDEYYYDYTGIPAGNHSYRWYASDAQGAENSTSVQNYQVDRIVSTCSLVFDPAGPTVPVYGTLINASCSCTNPEASAVLLRDGTDVTAAENDQYVVIDAGAHDYECSVIQTANYTSATTGVTVYNVDKAPSQVNLTLNGAASDINVNINDPVDIVGSLVTPVIGNIELYEDTNMINSGASPLTNTTSYSSVGNHNITIVYQETLNYLSSFISYFIDVMPSVYVVWNQSVLNLGQAQQGGGSGTGSENITATGDNTNVVVGCSSGDCAVIADLWIDGANMTDGETQTVDFSCNTATVGNFSAVFDVVSDEFASGDQITVSCEIIPAPPVFVVWNNPTLDLGSGEQGGGAEIGYENITATNANTNVTVTCSSGNCTEITDDWTDGTNMIDGEGLVTTFTCDDTNIGTYSAVFDVVSDEDTTADQITVGCIITPPVVNTGDVRLNEFMANPSSGSDWVEIYNNDVNIINLTGWVLNDSLTTSSMATLSGVINPGEFLSVDVGARLNMGGDDIILIDSALTTVDSHTYTSSQSDVAVGRYPDATGSWQDMGTATPGSANIPIYEVLWNQPTLDLGAGDQGAGALTGSANITATNANTNVVVSCLPFDPNCGTVIVDDWTTQDMTDGQSEVVTFTCNDSTVGNYTAIFNLVSDEDSIVDQISVSCEILLVPVYGVSLTDPADLATDTATNAVYTITIMNIGNTADIFDLAVNNIDGATTANLNQSTASLGPGASADFTLTVGDSTVGTYTVNITATSQTDITATDEIQIVTTVSAVPFYNVDIVTLTADQQITNTQTAVYDLQVTNTGNQADSFDLSVNNLDSADTATLNTYTLSNLNPGASATVQLSVADSTPGLYEVNVMVVSQTDSNSNDTTANIQTNIIQAVGNMSGTVDDNFGTPLSNINVSIDLTGWSALSIAGAYSILGITPATYSVTATPPTDTYLSQTKTGQVVNPDSTTTVNFVLTQTGTINGTVLEFFNPTTPISGATVTAMQGSTSYGSDTTDVNGNYAITGLAPGDYDVHVSHPSYTDTSDPVNDVLSGQTKTVDFYLW